MFIFQSLIGRIEKWQEEARAAIEQSKCESSETLSSSDLRELVERGEEFDVRLTEVDQLWRVCLGNTLTRSADPMA